MNNSYPVQQQTIRTIVSAAEADYAYWNSMQESTEAIQISRATSYYVKFIETIINGLNAIYSYHHAEEFIGRFLKRKHFFSLREEEFPSFSAQLADEMVASGNSPNGQYDRDMVISHIQKKAQRWYYLLDGYDNAQYKKDKDTIADIIAYDLTKVFYPSQLDQTLLDLYAEQFDFSHSVDTVLFRIGRKIGLDDGLISYLVFQRHMPDNWEEMSSHQATEAFLDARKQIGQADRTQPDLQNISYAQVIYRIRQQYRPSLSDTQSVYRTAAERVEKLLSSTAVEQMTDDDISLKTQDILSELVQITRFPSNTYEDASVQNYLFEKLRIWRNMLSEVSQSKQSWRIDVKMTTRLLTHDILRPLCDPALDNAMKDVSERLYQYDTDVLLIIAGQSLKFSDKFIRYMMFHHDFPDWDTYTDMQVIRNLAPRIRQTVQRVQETYARFNKLPKSQYNRLTKSFTSYYTIKKIIEIYYEHEYDEGTGDREEKVDRLYKKYVKGGAQSPEEQVRGLFQRLQRNTRFFTEDVFDELVYLYMASDMAKQGVSSFAEYIEKDANREKIQAVVFQRYDEFTFKRIMNRNYAGLGNLFGTKGFIIFIEAYLIGSGIEYGINHSIEYIARNIAGGTAFFRDVFFSPTIGSLAQYLYEPDEPLFPEAINLSLSSFASGWGMIDWGRTALSLSIPIVFMLLITSYNYFFHTLNRQQNRANSFQALKNVTKRWLSRTTHTISFTRKKNTFFLFELFRMAILVFEVYVILSFLIILGFEPTQIGLFFFLLTTICLSAYQGNKLKEEVTLGQSEMITDTIRDIIFIPILEIGRVLSGSARSINFIPWLVREGVEPLYKPVVMFLQSFITFQKEKKEELL